MLNKLLSYQSHEYFAERKDQQFLFITIAGIMKLAKIFFYNGNYYYDFPGIQAKCIMTPSLALKELTDLEIRLDDDKFNIFGKVGGYGVSNTPYVYVYWHSHSIANFLHTHKINSIPTKFPMPTALYNVNLLITLGV